MRKELKYMVYLHLLVLGLLLYLTFDLLTLAVDDTSQDALSDSELNSPEEWGNKPELIPRIIHQTYKTNEVPEQWREGQQQCIDLHPDYSYMFWSDVKARDFIEKEYPWFLDTFDGYQYPIERADAIRYFILAHYGGIYIDLDDGCKRKLDPLLTFPAFVRKTSPTGISNDVMGSIPNHPFFTKVMNSLVKYDRNWVVPYITIMFSTGPLFVSVIWKQYKRWGVPEGSEVRILQPAEYKLLDSAFFHIAAGSSWHSDDANFIKLMANHILACVVLGFFIGFVVLYVEYCIYMWLSAGGGARSVGKGISRMFTWNGASASGAGYTATSSSETGSMQRTRRHRKDSNLPVHVVLTDLEKQDPKFMDLSSNST